MREGLKQAAVALVLAALVGGGWAADRLWPWHPDPIVATATPIVTLNGDQVALRVPAAALTAEVGTYSEELPAYLNSQFLWSRVMQQHYGTEVVLSQSAGGEAPDYRIFLVLPKDLLTALPFLSTLVDEGCISRYQLAYWSASDLEYQQAASQVLEASYNLPAPMPFDALDERDMIGSLTHFILFKSRTDVRVRERIGPALAAPTVADARRQAGDIIDVARFYHLPLDQFAGIAAQENNYLNVDGDLKHAIWKRRADPGDVVLGRRRGRVLVSDYSMGEWQISRESMRFAHLLYMRDDRDYALLPARLRPSGDFRADAARPDVLTTYAGLLFRHLIDHFEGDIAMALGAYNGGCGDPQPAYSASVAVAAASARRTVEESTALVGWQVIPVEIIPYSPPQTGFRPTFSDAIRGDANQVIDEIASRAERFRSIRRKTHEVAESQPAAADDRGDSAPASGLQDAVRSVQRSRHGVYTVAEPVPTGNSQ